MTAIALVGTWVLLWAALKMQVLWLASYVASEVFFIALYLIAGRDKSQGGFVGDCAMPLVAGALLLGVLFSLGVLPPPAGQDFAPSRKRRFFMPW